MPGDRQTVRRAVAGVAAVLLVAGMAGAWIRLGAGAGTGYGWRVWIFTALLWALWTADARSRAGWGRIAGFAALATGLSLAGEIFGLHTGWLYGSYRYERAFPGPRLAAVPVAVPLIWCGLAALAWSAWRTLLRAARVAPWIDVGGAAALLVSYDLVADPNHVRRGGWTFDDGPWRGVPWTNYMGWSILALLTLGAARAARLDVAGRGGAVSCGVYAAVLLYEAATTIRTGGASLPSVLVASLGLALFAAAWRVARLRVARPRSAA